MPATASNYHRQSMKSAALRTVADGFLPTASASIPFFYTKEWAPYSKSAIGKYFQGILWDVGIPYKGKQLGPRVHDIRHTFCCHNIQKWAETEVPIYSKLLILSRYLGHSSISSTQYYLRLTAQAFPHIRDACEKELGGMYAPFSLAMESEGLQDG